MCTGKSIFSYSWNVKQTTLTHLCNGQEIHITQSTAFQNNFLPSPQSEHEVSTIISLFSLILFSPSFDCYLHNYFPYPDLSMPHLWHQDTAWWIEPGWTLRARQHSLSLPSSDDRGQKLKKRLLGQQKGRDDSLVTITGKANSIWGKINLLPSKSE